MDSIRCNIRLKLLYRCRESGAWNRHCDPVYPVSTIFPRFNEITAAVSIPSPTC